LERYTLGEKRKGRGESDSVFPYRGRVLSSLKRQKTFLSDRGLVVTSPVGGV